LERLKILMQVQGNEKVYTGVWQGMSHMWRGDGLRGLFKGNGLNCIRIIPNSAIKFLTYEQLTRKISHALIDAGGDGQMTPALRLAAGAGAGIVGMSATYPMDMVRGRITIQDGTNQQYRGLVHATRRIVAEEGVLALWRGWLPSVIGVVPYVGLNFAVYETLKDVLVKMYGERTGGREEGAGRQGGPVWDGLGGS
jgi:solute carrier family 25 phosphate transporter 23/24/25/41